MHIYITFVLRFLYPITFQMPMRYNILFNILYLKKDFQNFRTFQAPSDEEIVEAEDLRAKLAETHRRRAGEAARRSRSREDPLRAREDIAEARRRAQEKLTETNAAGDVPTAQTPAAPVLTEPILPSETAEPTELTATAPSEVTAPSIAQRKKAKRTPRTGIILLQHC